MQTTIGLESDDCCRLSLRVWIKVAASGRKGWTTYVALISTYVDFRVFVPGL